MKKNEMEALVAGLRKIGADIAGLADALEGKQEKGEDVQVEMQIQDRLKNYPVPGLVWDEYHLD